VGGGIAYDLTNDSSFEKHRKKIKAKKKRKERK
jgi:hypothetical protein